MSFVRQQSAKGLGHAIWCAREIIGSEPFAVLLPDVLIKSKKSCLSQMVGAYKKVGGNVIAVDAIPHDQVSKYGVINPQKREGNIIQMSGMVEKPNPNSAPSNLKITGRYILQPEIMNILENQAAGINNEIQLTDAMVRLMQNQKFYAYEYEGKDYDCGSKLGYFEAVLAYAKDHSEIGEQARSMIKRFSQ